MRLQAYCQKFILILLLAAACGACTSVHGPANEIDPLEPYNRAMYSFNEGFYDYILDPVVDAYETITPDFMQTGVTNFFNHLDDVKVMFNCLLQFKPRDFAHTLVRFVYNTVFGFFGLVDVAKHMGLPKLEEDFGQTLGVWGIPAGPYFMQPLLGPSTIRDTTGDYVDWVYMDPINLHIDDIGTKNALIGLKAIDTRMALLKVDSVVTKATVDKYAFIRDAYLQRRQYLVYDGNPPREKPAFEPSSKEDLELEEALEKELLQ